MPAAVHSDRAARALADIAAIPGYGSFFAIRVGGSPDGWHPIGQSYARGMADLVADRHSRYTPAEPRVAASVVQLGHAARLWSPVLACAVAHRIVLDLTGLQRSDTSGALRLPRADGYPATACGPLAATLYELVVERHLEPMAAGMRVRVARRLLYGNAASALTEAARYLAAARPALREPLSHLVAELLTTGQLAACGTVLDPDFAFRRRSCCLYYRVPGTALCGDCGLTGKLITHDNRKK